MAEGSREEAGTTAGVRTALRLLFQEAQRLFWQILLVGSGLWLEAAISGQRLVADVAGALEHDRLQVGNSLAKHWRGGISRVVRSRLVRVLRRCEPGAQAAVRLAARADEALLNRRGLGSPWREPDRR